MSMDPDTAVRLERMFRAAQDWSVRWGLTRLMRDVDIEFAEDMGDALGRCDLRTLQVRLHGVLLDPRNERLLHETLCHELAHIVASVRYGTRIAEHGVEWAGYMKMAGFDPRPVVPWSAVQQS